MTLGTDSLEFLFDRLADVETTWSMGTFGAIAEFARDPDEPSVLHREADDIAVATTRGGIGIVATAGFRLFASESLTTQSWNQRVVLCLPEAACAMSRRTVLTEIGPDQAPGAAPPTAVNVLRYLLRNAT